MNQGDSLFYFTSRIPSFLWKVKVSFFDDCSQLGIEIYVALPCLAKCIPFHSIPFHSIPFPSLSFPFIIVNLHSVSYIDPSQEMPQTLNNFLHLAAPAAVIIRMRGLPYNTKASEIVSTNSTSYVKETDLKRN